jgi:hypothetical protein
MNTLIKNYEGHEISFNLLSDDLMVNANQMEKLFDKKIRNFLRLKETQSFIEEIKKSQKYIGFIQRNYLTSEIVKGGVIGGKSKDFLDNSVIMTFEGKNGGTYMYRTLALKFAAWLNPAFELWIYETIENLLFSDKSKEIINYLQNYPPAKFKKLEADGELKNALALSGYSALEDEKRKIEIQIADFKENQKEIAIRSLIDEQGDFFKDSREILYNQYITLQKKIQKLDQERRSILSKMGIIKNRIDIKQITESIQKHSQKMRSLKKAISIN